jgi:hypothetical protein
MAGPGDCTILENGACGWEIITCSQITFTGYLREIEASWCMDNCSNYYIESESGAYLSNVTALDDMGSLSIFKDRYVDLGGEEVWCVECGAVDAAEIYISDASTAPHSTHQNSSPPRSTYLSLKMLRLPISSRAVTLLR